MVYWTPHPCYFDLQPLEYHTPFPWCIGSPTNVMLTLYPSSIETIIHRISDPLPMAFLHPTYGISNPLSLISWPPPHGIFLPTYRVFNPPTQGMSTPYLWYFDLHTHGISNPYQWCVAPIPMVYQTAIHGVSQPYPWNVDLLATVFWTPYPWYFDQPTHGISNSLFTVYRTP